MDVLNVNPIGETKDDEKISGFIDGLKERWDEIVASIEGSGRISMVYITKFLLGTLDGLIVFVNTLLHGETGPDKKATVMAAIIVLYDHVVAQALPFWLRPFARSIKYFIIYTVVSIAVDWIVSKYRDGSWKEEPPTTEIV